MKRVTLMGKARWAAARAALLGASLGAACVWPTEPEDVRVEDQATSATAALLNLNSMPPRRAPGGAGGNPYAVATEPADDGCDVDATTAINERKAKLRWSCGSVTSGYSGSGNYYDTSASPPEQTYTVAATSYVDCGLIGQVVYNPAAQCAYAVWRDPWYYVEDPTPCPLCSNIRDRWVGSGVVRAFLGMPRSQPIQEGLNWYQEFDYGILAHDAVGTVRIIGGRALITGAQATNLKIGPTQGAALVGAWKVRGSHYKRPAADTAGESGGFTLATNAGPGTAAGGFAVSGTGTMGFYLNGAIYDYWVAHSRASGSYGWPISDMKSVAGGSYAEFTGGRIYYNSQNALAHGVSGAILTKYLELGGHAAFPSGVMGLPTTDVIPLPPAKQYFQNGWIDVNGDYVATQPPQCSWICGIATECNQSCTDGSVKTCGDYVVNGAAQCQTCSSLCTNASAPGDLCVSSSGALSSCGAQGVCSDCASTCADSGAYCVSSGIHCEHTFDAATKSTSLCQPSPCGVAQCPAAPPNAVVGSFPTITTSTSSATVGYYTFPLGTFQAGTTVRVGTCGIKGAAFSGKTFLRLFNATTATQVTDSTGANGQLNARCDDDTTAYGNQLNYVVPYDMTLELHAGCAGTSINCSGTVAMEARLDAAPRPAAVITTFNALDTNGDFMGVKTEGMPAGIIYEEDAPFLPGSFHMQGIARTYVRTAFDFAFTASVRLDDAAPNFNDIFFAKIGNEPNITLAQPFATVLDWRAPDLPPSPCNARSPSAIAACADKLIAAAHVGVYDTVNRNDPSDWDGLDNSTWFNHADGMQAIGRYLAVGTMFVGDDAPSAGNDGQAGQVVLFDTLFPDAAHQKLLISRTSNWGVTWVAIAKLKDALTVPPALRNGYIIMVRGDRGERMDIWAIQADPCTGYASLDNITPYREKLIPPRLDMLAPETCPGPRTDAEQAAADKRRVQWVDQFCQPRATNPNACSENYRIVVQKPDGSPTDFSYTDDSNVWADDSLQNVDFISQANGTLFMLALEGVKWDLNDPNSEGRLYKVVWGAASGIDAMRSVMPDGTTCQKLMCLVRYSGKNVNPNGPGMGEETFKYGAGSYIVTSPDPALDKIMLYGTSHYETKGLGFYYPWTGSATVGMFKFNEF